MKKIDSIFEIFNLKGKTIILTGSAGRIGRRFANVLSQAGADLILVDIEKSKNEKLSKEITKKYKTNCDAYYADFSDSSDIINLVNYTLKKYGKIDVLINNAHFIPRKDSKLSSTFEEYPLELWNKTIDINLRGLFLCCQKVGKVMVKQKKGVIVNVSSIYGLVGADQRIYGKSKLNSPSFYAATKGAMVNLTRYLASYWQGKNIRVNTITLGGVFDKKLHTDKTFLKKYSEKTILGRMANNEDFDGAILFLASNASSYMTGANLVIDGGWTAW